MTRDIVAVTGASGYVGGRVSRGLAASGAHVRLVLRDRNRAPEIAGAEVRTAAGYGDEAGMRDALAGAGTVFLVPAKESEDRVEQHRKAIDAATAAGVQRIVYLSFVGASPRSTFTLVREHFATEEHVRARGVAFTFLRMNLYTDFVPLLVLPSGVIRGPGGEGRFSPVARDDVARAATAVLTTEGHDARVYDLTGPESLSLSDAARCLARLCGKPIRFENETVEAAFAARREYGAPSWQLEAWVSTYTAIAAGELDVSSDAVAHLTGRAPLSLDAYVRAHPDCLRHVSA